MLVSAALGAEARLAARVQVEQLGARFGVNLAVERVEDLKTMYGIYVESAIPTGDAPLTGSEADAIRSFKVALGLSDEEAAPVHLDVGRRLTRLGAEAGSREGGLLEKKARPPPPASIRPQRNVGII